MADEFSNLHGALMQAGMTTEQADRVSIAVNNLVMLVMDGHIATEHVEKPKEPKPRAKSKKPQARRRWKKR